MMQIATETMIIDLTKEVECERSMFTQHQHCDMHSSHVKVPPGLVEEEDYIEKVLKLVSMKGMSDCLKTAINDRAKEFLESLTPAIAKFLREDLDVEKYSEQDVKTLIQCAPSALSEMNEDGMVPIQCITWDYSDLGFNTSAIPFIPLLAEEGRKHNVGGAGMRGGLLCGQDSDSDCVLQEIACVHHAEDKMIYQTDAICLDVMKKLRGLDLFFEDDIKDLNLVSKACHPSSKKRFEYLSNWNPKALKKPQDLDGELSLLRDVINDPLCYDRGLENFRLVLAAGLQHFPLELGLLSEMDCEESSVSVLSEAYTCFGRGETWKVIEECLKCTDKKYLLDKNPETNMHPFMMLAADGQDSSDLDIIYHLLRQNPIVLESGIKADRWVDDSQLVGRKRKRS